MHQSLTLQRIHCPKIISSATHWQDKECFFAESKIENVGTERDEETIGAHGKVLKKLA